MKVIAPERLNSVALIEFTAGGRKWSARRVRGLKRLTYYPVVVAAVMDRLAHGNQKLPPPASQTESRRRRRLSSSETWRYDKLRVPPPRLISLAQFQYRSKLLATSRIICIFEARSSFPRKCFEAGKSRVGKGGIFQKIYDLEILVIARTFGK